MSTSQQRKSCETSPRSSHRLAIQKKSCSSPETSSGSFIIQSRANEDNLQPPRKRGRPRKNPNIYSEEPTDWDVDLMQRSEEKEDCELSTSKSLKSVFQNVTAVLSEEVVEQLSAALPRWSSQLQTEYSVQLLPSDGRVTITASDVATLCAAQERLEEIIAAAEEKMVDIIDENCQKPPDFSTTQPSPTNRKTSKAESPKPAVKLGSNCEDVRQTSERPRRNVKVSEKVTHAMETLKSQKRSRHSCDIRDNDCVENAHLAEKMVEMENSRRKRNAGKVMQIAKVNTSDGRKENGEVECCLVVPWVLQQSCFLSNPGDSSMIPENTASTSSFSENVDQNVTNSDIAQDQNVTNQDIAQVEDTKYDAESTIVDDPNHEASVAGKILLSLSNGSPIDSLDELRKTMKSHKAVGAPSLIITVQKEEEEEECNLPEFLLKLEGNIVEEEMDPAESYQLLRSSSSKQGRLPGPKQKGGEILCDLCREYSGSHMGVICHKKRYHASRVYKCDLCFKVFGIKTECLRHRVTHEKKKVELLKAITARNKLAKLEDNQVQHIISSNITKSMMTMYRNPEKVTDSCEFCDYKGTKVGLIWHKRRYHPKHPLCCDECGKYFGTKYALKVHMGYHALNKDNSRVEIENDIEPPEEEVVTEPLEIHDDFKQIHTCDICGYISTRHGITSHKARNHREKTLECDICHKKFARNCDLKFHHASHYDDSGNLRPPRLPPKPKDSDDNIFSRYHSCEICGYESTYFGVKSHKQRVHTEKTVQCDICLKMFTSITIMNKHKASHFDQDGDLKPWIKAKVSRNEGDDPHPETFHCEKCDVDFFSMKALEIHISKKHVDLKKKSFLCEYCLFTASRKEIIDGHVARKHHDHKFKCELCSKTYAFEKDLNEHIRIIHEQKGECFCDICGMKFRAPKYLKAHMQRHNNEYKCYCSVCNKGFMDRSKLNEHQETHKAVEDRNLSFWCQVCGKGFLRKATLQGHMNGHRGERPHVCKKCGKCFTLPQSLSKHMKRHGVFKPFRCTFPGCTKAFYEQSSLQSHRVTHTRQGQHRCPTCNKVFTQALTLKRHVCKFALPSSTTVAPMIQLGSEIVKIENVDNSIIIQPEMLQSLSSLSNIQTIHIPENLDGNMTENITIVVKTDPVMEPEPQPENESGEVYMCSVCRQLFDTMPEVELHMQSHVENEGSQSYAYIEEQYLQTDGSDLESTMMTVGEEVSIADQSVSELVVAEVEQTPELTESEEAVLHLVDEGEGECLILETTDAVQSAENIAIVEMGDSENILMMQ